MQTWKSIRGYLAVMLLCVIAFGGYLLYERRPQPEPITIIQASPMPTQTVAPMVVHVAGAVQRPGVYTLEPGSRVQDAVLAAGGLTRDVDESTLNLADRLLDGQRLEIGVRGSPAGPSPTPIAPSTLEGQQRSYASPGVPGVLNINTATADELVALPGIGPVYAQRIVEYRETVGRFQHTEEIMNVSGIGPARYAQLKEMITVD